jgi:NAD+ diphosphatase
MTRRALPPMGGHQGFDRAAHRREDEAWLMQAWGRARILLITSKSEARVKDGAIYYVGSDDVPIGATWRFLGEVDGVPHFCATVAESIAKEFGEWATLRDLGAGIDELDAAMLAAAIGLEQWHQRHRRCAICGEPTQESLAGWTRSCENDGSTHFPRTDPAVIMLVTTGTGEDARCLLGRSEGWPEGRFSTLAGFVEPGESLEATVAREVAEESGVRVDEIRYLASQPWPFPSSLMIGFAARLVGDDRITVDGSELVEAGWFTREQVRRAAERTDSGTEQSDPDGVLQYVSPRLSISRWLLDEWLDGRVD